MSDVQQQLIERIRTGDEAALADFIELRRAAWTAFIERNLSTALRRKVEADDIFQEASVDCIRALSKVDLSERDPFSWLCQMAERRIIDAHRRFFGAQKRDAAREAPISTPGSPDETQKGGVIDLLVDSMTSPSAAFSRDQRQVNLLVAIEQLPEECRTALRMRYVENLPTKEIAASLGKTDGALRVMLTRSLKKLQELLGPDSAPR